MERRKVTAEEVIGLRELGLTYREVESRLGISRMTAWRRASVD